MLVKGSPGIFQPQPQMCILVCFSEHCYRLCPGCSVSYTTVNAGGCVTVYLYWMGLSFIFHRNWSWGFIIFTAANDKRYVTSYQLVISIIIVIIIIIIIIINKWCATINGICCQHYIFPRSCPSDRQKSCILSLLCLYPGVCTCSPRLPTEKYSLMTRTRICWSFRSQNRFSELPTFNHCVKCSSIRWWSNKYWFETIVCHKIFNNLNPI